MATKTSKLETEPCTRCGGSGHYSYCQRDGTTCFRCHGTGITHTARGAAALAYLTAIRSKPASEVKVGDKIRVELFGIESSVMNFETVEQIEPLHQNGTYTADGVTYPIFVITIITKSLSWNTKPDAPIRMALTNEQKNETLARALAYQETLTKSGTVRKLSALAA